MPYLLYPSSSQLLPFSLWAFVSLSFGFPAWILRVLTSNPLTLLLLTVSTSTLHPCSAPRDPHLSTDSPQQARRLFSRLGDRNKGTKSSTSSSQSFCLSFFFFLKKNLLQSMQTLIVKHISPFCTKVYKHIC